MHARGARVHPASGHQEWLEYAAEVGARYEAKVVTAAPSASALRSAALQAKYETVRAKLLLHQDAEAEPPRLEGIWTAADSARNWSMLAQKVAQMHGIRLSTQMEGGAVRAPGVRRARDVGRDERRPLHPSKAANANAAAPIQPLCSMFGSYVPPRRTLASCVGRSQTAPRAAKLCQAPRYMAAETRRADVAG
jgi:hypothetical protein